MGKGETMINLYNDIAKLTADFVNSANRAVGNSKIEIAEMLSVTQYVEVKMKGITAMNEQGQMCWCDIEWNDGERQSHYPVWVGSNPPEQTGFHCDDWSDFWRLTRDSNGEDFIITNFYN
jgi:hypothetical protein